MSARAITPGQTVEEVITDEAGEVDLSSELLRKKMAALFNGWPDEWGGHSPDGVIVTAYRGDTPHSRDVGREAP